MNDSDETVCEMGEESEDSGSESQMSPSVIAPVSRSKLAGNELINDKNTGDVESSPEFLPPKAKIKRSEEAVASEGSETNKRPAASQRVENTDSKMIPEEKLNSIKLQEEKIEELLKCLELKAKKGIATKEDPVFAEVKFLMTKIKMQLGDLSQHQKQQRQEITQSKDELRSRLDGNGSQGNLEAKQKLFELAARQKMLLQLYKRHKELLQWTQALKKKLQGVAGHILPSVEMHWNAQNTANVATTTVTSIATVHLPFQSQSAVTMTTSCLPPTLLATSTVQDIPPPKAVTVSRISRPQLAPLTGNTSISSQQNPPLQGNSLDNTPHTMQSQFNLKSSLSASMATITQPVIQKVTLTGAQLYQIGGRQFYLLSQAQTQPKNLQSLAEPPVTHSTTVASNKNLPARYLSVEGNQQNKSIPSGLGNLPFSSQTSTESTCAPTSTHSPQVTCHTMSTMNSTLKSAAIVTFSPPAMSSSALTFLNSQPQKSVGIDQPKCYPSPATEPMRVEANASCISKAPISQRKGGHTLQRRNSFGSDLPDLKSLLYHNIIQAGTNVLTVLFEGRNFEASLKANGLLESAGGETFRTPMAWMRAVTGSWNNIKASQAYKMVHYQGKPLAKFTLPPVDKGSHNIAENAESLKMDCERLCTNEQNSSGSPAEKKEQSRHNGLITSWNDLAQLLTDCRVMPIGRDELTPTNTILPENFWDSASHLDIPLSVLQDLDF